MHIFSDTRFKSECYFWIGKKPCFPQIDGKTIGCVKCRSYKPIRGNVLIIEAGGLGSILRTTTISKEIKRLNPNFQVQWLTNEKGLELLSGNVPNVDRVLTCNDETIQILLAQKFKMVINFESAPLFLSIARRLSADRKFGYTMGDLGMKWNRQTYDLATNKADDDWAREFFYENEIDIYKSHFNKVIGFNIGTSNKLRTKRWSPKHYHKLAQMVQEKHPDWKILILAGPEDITQYDAFSEINAHKPLNNLIFSGYGNTISRFISLVQQTSIVVSADTFGMHVAIGLEKIVVALFGPQPFAEVELYDRGKKLKLDLNCTPCFKGKPEQCFNVSHLACMQNLEPNYVFGVLEKQLNNLTIIPLR